MAACAAAASLTVYNGPVTAADLIQSFVRAERTEGIAVFSSDMRPLHSSFQFRPCHIREHNEERDEAPANGENSLGSCSRFSWLNRSKPA